ncbi:alpha/beta hydrolase [Pseudoxanthomonas kalamensis DSM 18571]|uniref:alpha/beta fold hydrolase n=1 Tax=Pseudoxanthomonas kalamensis TaxID=289483 RepID=UPI0013920545|nr:alpha/beta fold hydrolase [Pseudoxanthomonas kalamensis]KAF1711503.1 alpha/beta hydrolase [Pseudoxanthomonas kalamensis DSM 18571]
MLRHLLLLACAGLWLAGQAFTSDSTSLSERIVAPGGSSPLIPRERLDAMLAALPSRSGLVDTPAGVPIFWRAIDPGDYRLHYAYYPASPTRTRADFELDFLAPAATAAAPRGTVILLHGWMMDGDSMLPWALQLAQAGYRSISLDLRNHGHSGGGPAGYGTREAEDVAAVIAALRARGEIRGPLYLFGVSYGAATALFTADRLGDQVAGVVAMESFANAGRGIRDMVPHMLSGDPKGLKAQATLQLARWRYGDQNLDAVIAAADRKLDVDLDRIDVTAALADTRACVLLVHGRNDRHIPVQHGRALALASPRARYLEVPGEDHLTLPMRMDELGPVVDGWLARTAGDGDGASCPQAPKRLPVPHRV